MNDETQQKSIPDSVLIKLFDLTGTMSDGTKGFVLLHLDKSGSPVAVSKFENNGVKIALETFALKFGKRQDKASDLA